MEIIARDATSTSDDSEALSLGTIGTIFSLGSPIISGIIDHFKNSGNAQQRRSAIELEDLVRRQLELIGEDPFRDGLLRTPSRVATALTWLTNGYASSVEEVVGNGIFEEAHSNMIMIRDIEVYSMCEHHMLPFFGKAHIGYIPDGRIVGLSKIPRIVDVFARRLQVQERLTEQVAAGLCDVIQPLGVGVVIEAQHLCMMMRGVEKQNSKTITSALRGIFRSDGRTREEFLRLAHNGGTSSR